MHLPACAPRTCSLTTSSGVSSASSLAALCRRPLALNTRATMRGGSLSVLSIVMSASCNRYSLSAPPRTTTKREEPRGAGLYPARSRCGGSMHSDDTTSVSATLWSTPRCTAETTSLRMRLRTCSSLAFAGHLHTVVARDTAVAVGGADSVCMSHAAVRMAPQRLQSGHRSAPASLAAPTALWGPGLQCKYREIPILRPGARARGDAL